MIELQLTQGSPEWIAHRQNYRNASDTPSVTGSSTYKSRAEFLKERATGITKEVDAATQRRFDDGHRFEKLARPLMERIIGEDLFPVVGIEGLYSASFDGLTMMGDTNAEHKTLNDAIRACETAADLPLMYREQMEHQMMVSGATRSLFMATKWSGEEGSETLEEETHFWYAPDMSLRQKIRDAWEQFDIDVQDYVPVEVIPAAVAAPTLDLPAVSIQTSGSIAIISNLTKFGESLKVFIDRLPAKPSTDQEFADCKAALTKLKTAEEALDSEEARALSQLDSVDEMRREKKLYQDLARTTRLALEKLVVAREAAIKNETVQSGKDRLAEHIATLNKRLGRVQMPVVAADFAGVIKSKRTISSLQNAVDTELARAKIAANEIADKIQINLAALGGHKDHAFLFNDVSTLVMKSPDDLANVIKLRINEHTAEQQRKIEAEREKIRAEEQAKAQREAAARAEVERKEKERISAEAKAKADREAAEKVAVVAQQVETIALGTGFTPITQAAEPVPTQASVRQTREAVPVPSQDYGWQIAGLVSQMTINEQKLVLHFCERTLAQRQEAA